MFYFILHHLLQGVAPDMTDIRRNCLTFLVGSVLYFIVYGLLREYPLFGFFKILRDFWWYFCAIDAISMAIIYRGYYGRSIVHELTDEGPGEGRWDYDEDQHQYKRSDLAEREHFFKDKLKTVNKIEETLDKAEETRQVVDEQVNQAGEIHSKVSELEENLENLQTAFEYRPEGELAQQMAEEVLTDFQENQGDHNL